jgi:threonine dehydrogenase-like Zn-dependent dehydrogenase
MAGYPRIPGHEIAATVAEAGADVPNTIKTGMNVTVSPYTSCGNCGSCRRGRMNACQFNQTSGVQRDGALTEYIVVPWQKVYRSDTLTLRELALVEPLTVGFHASARGRVAGSDVVAVFGCGAIGLGAAAGSLFRGGAVIAIDIDDSKLDIGKKVGADQGINSRKENLHERLQELTEGYGPDVVIEAVGLPDTYRAAVEEVAYAGRVVYIGYAKESVEFDTARFVQKELDIHGSRNATSADFSDVISMLEGKRFPVDDVVTETVPFDQADTALRRWADNPGDVTKILVEVSG